MRLAECLMELIAHTRWLTNTCLTHVSQNIQDQYPDDMELARDALAVLSKTMSHIELLSEFPTICVNALCCGSLYLLAGEQVFGSCPPTMHQYLVQSKNRRMESSAQTQLLTVRWFLSLEVVSLDDLLEVIFGPEAELNFANDYERDQTIADQLATNDPFFIGAHILMIRGLVNHYCRYIITVDDVMKHVALLSSPTRVVDDPYTLEDALLHWLRTVIGMLDPTAVALSLELAHVDDLYLHTNDGRALCLAAHHYRPDLLSCTGIHFVNPLTVWQRQDNWSNVIRTAESLGLWVGLFADEVVAHGFATLQLHVLRIVEELFAVLAGAAENSINALAEAMDEQTSEQLARNISKATGQEEDGENEEGEGQKGGDKDKGSNKKNTSIVNNGENFVALSPPPPQPKNKGSDDNADNDFDGSPTDLPSDLRKSRQSEFSEYDKSVNKNQRTSGHQRVEEEDEDEEEQGGDVEAEEEFSVVMSGLFLRGMAAPIHKQQEATATSNDNADAAAPVSELKAAQVIPAPPQAAAAAAATATAAATGEMDQSLQPCQLFDPNATSSSTIVSTSGTFGDAVKAKATPTEHNQQQVDAAAAAAAAASADEPPRSTSPTKSVSSPTTGGGLRTRGRIDGIASMMALPHQQQQQGQQGADALHSQQVPHHPAAQLQPAGVVDKRHNPLLQSVAHFVADRRQGQQQGAVAPAVIQGSLDSDGIEALLTELKQMGSANPTTTTTATTATTAAEGGSDSAAATELKKQNLQLQWALREQQRKINAMVAKISAGVKRQEMKAIVNHLKLQKKHSNNNDKKEHESTKKPQQHLTRDEGVQASFAAPTAAVAATTTTQQQTPATTTATATATATDGGGGGNDGGGPALSFLLNIAAQSVEMRTGKRASMFQKDSALGFMTQATANAVVGSGNSNTKTHEDEDAPVTDMPAGGESAEKKTAATKPQVEADQMQQPPPQQVAAAIKPTNATASNPALIIVPTSSENSSQQQQKQLQPLQRIKQRHEKRKQELRARQQQHPSSAPSGSSGGAPSTGGAGTINTRNNKTLISNAIKFVCLTGPVNRIQQEQAQCILSVDEASHFVILLKDEFGLAFKGLYAVRPAASQHLTRVFGSGPMSLFVGQSADGAGDTTAVPPRLFKFDSGGKRFLPLSSTQFNSTVDGVAFSALAGRR